MTCGHELLYLVDEAEQSTIVSIMVEEELSAIPIDNIRSLLYILAESLDERLKQYRKGTRYESVRPSDVRVFMIVWRQARTMSEIARVLKVSRQAVHMSIKRLAALKIVDFDPNNHSGREKRIIVTDRGLLARQTAQQQVGMLEAECEAAIGPEGMEMLRTLLSRLCQRLATEEYQRLLAENYSRFTQPV